MISQTQLNRIHRAARQIGRRGRLSAPDVLRILGSGTGQLSGSIRRIAGAIESLQGPQRYSTRKSQPASGKKSGWGSLLDSFLDAISAPDVTLDDITAAAELLEGVGFRVTGPGDIQPPPVIRTPTPVPGKRRIGPPARAPVGAPPLPGEESGYGQETLTPQSSNVFSFSFVPFGGEGKAKSIGTLYVTYKAPRLHAAGVSHGRGAHGGRSQILGTRGRTIAGKTNQRGPMYAYDGVPTRVYRGFLSAASKGKFVWDNLRVRGTIHGTRYPYRLVQGAVITQAGISGQYVPRKATKTGFTTRSLADLGTGRRGFVSSTLPSQRGFSTRKR